MKNFKKIMVGVVAALGVTALTACNKTEEKTKLVDEVLGKIVLIQDKADVSADFTVPKTVVHQGTTYNISWTSSDTSVLSFADNTDPTKYTADVHQPFTADTDVVLTASTTAADEEGTLEFKTTVTSIKAEDALKKVVSGLGVKSVCTEETTMNLPAEYTDYAEKVTLAYTLGGEYASTKLEGNKLTLTPSNDVENVELKVTATAGSNKYEETLNIKVTSAVFGEGVPYVLSLVHGNKDNKVLYFTGEMSGYYAATTEDATKAKPVYFEKVNGGYNLSFFDKDAKKKYFNLVKSGTYINVKFEDAASTVWMLNGTYNTLSTMVDGQEYYIGTYGTNVTISASKISYAPTSFPCHVSLGEGIDYSLSVIQGKKDNKEYFLNGEMSGYYGATTEDATKAKAYRVEAVEGGYHLYFLGENNAKTYVNLVASGTYVNLKYEDKATSVWNVNAIYGVLTSMLNEKEYVLGCYGTYNTVGPQVVDNLSIAQTEKYYTFPCKLGISVASAEPEEPETPVAPAEPLTSATAKHSETATTNIDKVKNPVTCLGLNDYVFDVTFTGCTAGNNTNQPGLNADGSTRLYNNTEGNGNTLTFTVIEGYKIDSITITFSTSEKWAKKGTLQVYTTPENILTEDNGVYIVNGNTVTLKNVATESSHQIWIMSIDFVLSQTA